MNQPLSPAVPLAGFEPPAPADAPAREGGHETEARPKLGFFQRHVEPDATRTAALAEGHTHIPLSFGMKAANLTAIVLPFVGLIVGGWMLWGVAFGWVHLILMAVMYAVTVLGVTVGFHRLFTHKSFETTPPVKAVLGVMGSMAVEGPLIKWVAMHRSHHKHSETVDDPHSPHLHGHGWKGLFQGLYYAHMGWLFSPEAADLPRYVPDLFKDRVSKRVSDLFTLWVAIGLLFPAVVAGLVTWSWTGALLGFLWGGLARIFLVHHVTWSINSVCHLWGRQEYRSRDESRNNVIFGILAFGEGWHNNHHAFPTSARHGLAWWQFDLSYVVIRTLELFGLAWKVRVPAAQQLEAKRIRPGEHHRHDQHDHHRHDHDDA